MLVDNGLAYERDELRSTYIRSITRRLIISKDASAIIALELELDSRTIHLLYPPSLYFVLNHTANQA